MRTLLLALPLAIAAPAFADDDWTGKTVISKRNGVKIGHTDPGGLQVFTAELKLVDFKVGKDKDGFLLIAEGNREDWAPKADDCCVLPCKTVSSPELAKSYCDLSNQQRSLHAGPQLPAPAILVEDGLALIAHSLKAPPPVFLSRFELDHSIQQPQEDLFILHRTLLL